MKDFFRLICLFPLVCVFTSCSGGSGSGTTTSPSPTVTSVTIACTPTSIQVGALSQCTGTRHFSDSTSDGNVTYSSDTTTVATVDTKGTTTSVAVGTANIIAKDAQGTLTGSAKITVTPGPPQPLSVNISANPTTVTAGGQTVITWSVGNATSSTKCSGADGLSGNEPCSGSATETPSSTAKYTINATDPTAGNATNSVTVTVDQPVAPSITSLSVDTLAVENIPSLPTMTITGTGFTSTDTVAFDVCPNILSGSIQGSTQITLQLQFAHASNSPGLCAVKVCTDSTGKVCSNIQTFAYVESNNAMAVSPKTGEIFMFDPTSDGNIRKYTSAGVAETPMPANGFGNCIGIDDKTNILVIDGGTENTDGSPTYIVPQGMSSSSVTDCVAHNGYQAIMQPSNNNSVSTFDMTGGSGSQPAVHGISLANHPVAMDLGVFGSSTYLFVATGDGTPQLYEISVPNMTAVGNPLALTGFTPMSALQANNTPQPGWYQVFAFEDGPAAGTIVVFSGPDKTLWFFDQSTWKEKGSPLKLSNNPVRVAADVADGRILVAEHATGSATITASVVVVLSQQETAITATSTDLPVGFGVSADGQTVYFAQRSDLQQSSVVEK